MSYSKFEFETTFLDKWVTHRYIILLLIIITFRYDEGVGPSLYFIDYMAALAKVNFGAQGYAANFVLSVFDREWTPGLDVEGGLGIIKKCIHELNTRFLISQPKFVIKIVDASGTRVLEL